MWPRRRRQQRREQEQQEQNQRRRTELLAQLDAAERDELTAEDFDFLDDPDNHLLTAEEISRWKEARNRVWAERAFKERLKQLKELRGRYAESTGTDEKVDALLAFYSYYASADYFEENSPRLGEALGTTKQTVKDLLQEAVKVRYQELVDGRGDPETFRKLRMFLHRAEYGDLHWVTRPGLPIPEDWNDLVARYYDTPKIEVFRDLPPYELGELRLRAAKAVQDDDLTLAQIVLACCNESDRNRSAVGEVLTAELAKLVVRHREAAAQSAPVADQLKE